MMNDTVSRSSQDTVLARSTVATTAILLGALQCVAILLYGLMLDPPELAPFGLVASVPVFAMTLATGSAPAERRPRSPWWPVAVPVAVGLLVLTLLVGTFQLPNATWWWVGGAVACALPYLWSWRLWSQA